MVSHILSELSLVHDKVGEVFDEGGNLGADVRHLFPSRGLFEKHLDADTRSSAGAYARLI